MKTDKGYKLVKHLLDRVNKHGEPGIHYYQYMDTYSVTEGNLNDAVNWLDKHGYFKQLNDVPYPRQKEPTNPHTNIVIDIGD